MVPELESERLSYRAWTPDAVDEYARICADPQVMRYMWPPRAATPAESAFSAKGIEEHWLRWGFGHWAVYEKDTGRFVGRTGIKRHDNWDLDPDNTEIGWLYDRAVWGRGYATEGAIVSRDYCLDELGRPEVISITHPDNRASQRVMEKAGLTYAGRRAWNEKITDVVWYSLRA